MGGLSGLWGEPNNPGTVLLTPNLCIINKNKSNQINKIRNEPAINYMTLVLLAALILSVFLL